MPILAVRPSAPMPVAVLAKPVRAGFPSPADDFIDDAIDLQRLLVRIQPATFIVKVAGDSMVAKGLFDGDLVVVGVDGERSFKVWSRRGLSGRSCFRKSALTLPSSSTPTRARRGLGRRVCQREPASLGLPGMSRALALIDGNSFYCSCERV